jgi:hypothetical protein
MSMQQIQQIEKRNSPRHGLTVVECLFAMTIILVGMVGVAFIVRFAGRQAVDSYKITQGLAAGENAIAFSNSHQALQPSLSQPWQIVDDGTATTTNSANSYFGTMERLHSYRYQNAISGSPTPMVMARIANGVLGTGYCMDPLFWGSQTRYGSKLGARSWDNIRPSLFPFYHMDYPSNFDPFGTGGTSYTPRLTRVTLRDPSPDLSGNNGWLKLPAARKLALASGGDLSTATPEQDQSFGPVRNMTTSVGDGSPLTSIQGVEAISNCTWLATLVPADETAIVEPTMVPLPTSGLPFVPEFYELSVVVLAKRDVREIAFPEGPGPTYSNVQGYSDFKTLGEPPVSERLLSVSFPNAAEAQTSGTFEIELSADATVSSSVRVGDWLMLSRETYVEPVSDTLSRRSRHKWYRIIGVHETNNLTGPLGNAIFSKVVRVSGIPWGMTLNEYEKIENERIRRALAGLPVFTPPAFPQTVATLLPNVITVYQRTFKASN